MTMTMTMTSAPLIPMSSQHITPRPARLNPSDDDLQSNSSKRRRKRRLPQLLPMTSLAFVVIIYMYCCDAYALSMPVSGTRRSSILSYKVHHQINSRSLNMSSGSRSRAKLSAMELSPIQRLYRHRLNKDIIEATQSGRNRLLKIAQLTRGYFRKLGLGMGKVTDDTSTSGWIGSSSATTSIAATTIYTPTTARISSIQLSVASTTTTIALHRQGRRGSSILSSPTRLQVLSTPDTIIEQASTQKLLDTLLDESVRTQSRQPVMLQFSPKRGWIWRQWRGTVFSETWKSGLTNMALATLVVFLYRLYPNLKDLLQGFSILWGQLLSVTTFTLTFFLNQSYGLWRKCYDYSRRLQGRLNDLGMTLAAHATRTKPSSPDVPSTYTPQSRQALELVSRYVRVFNLLTYASFTRSHRPILTPRGMRRLVERGILTPKEREILTDAEVPATQRHNAVLVWLIRLFLEGRQAGVFEGGTGFEQQFMEKCHVIRAQYGAIGDELQGRMPLAYAHIVQVLLDVVLWMYPFMALSSGMGWWFSILGTGLLTMFYQGLFDLAKQFLDPYDNENYGKGDDPLVIDTLIAETNAGSVRWMNSFQQQPWNRQRLIDGELYDSILPLRGYSLDDLAEKEAQEEKERQEKEVAIKEKRRKEEEKDRQKAEQILMGHVENIKNGTSTAVSEVVNGAVVLTPAGELLMSSVVDDEIFSNKTFIEVSGDGVVTTSPLSSQGIETGNKNESVTDGLSASSTSTSDSITDSAVLAPLDDTTNIAWANLGATPNFAESISEIEQYKASPSLSQFNVNIDEDIDEDFEDDLFQPINIEWFEEIGPDGKEYRKSLLCSLVLCCVATFISPHGGS
jgi:predicted membrane chloride channel (bestrophin family)